MNNFPKIAESEWRIMKILWTDSPKTANEIVELLSKETKWNPRTTKTLLNRLVKKGALGFKKDGRTYLYYPLVSKDECAQKERTSVLNRVYDGALKPLLVSFIEEENLTNGDIEELQKILDQKKAPGIPRPVNPAAQGQTIRRSRPEWNRFRKQMETDRAE